MNEPSEEPEVDAEVTVPNRAMKRKMKKMLRKGKPRKRPVLFHWVQIASAENLARFLIAREKKRAARRSTGSE